MTERSKTNSRSTRPIRNLPPNRRPIKVRKTTADKALTILIMKIFENLAENHILTFDAASALLEEIVQELPSLSNDALRRFGQIQKLLFVRVIS